MAKLHITSFDGLSITIEGESPDLDGQALETAAILEIIKHVDTGRWENEDVEAGHAFYAAVLGAVARHYAVDDPVS